MKFEAIQNMINIEAYWVILSQLSYRVYTPQSSEMGVYLLSSISE